MIEYRNAAGKLDQVARNAVELVRLKVDSHRRWAPCGHLIILLTVAHIVRPVRDGWVQQREKPRVRPTDLV